MSTRAHHPQRTPTGSSKTGAQDADVEGLTLPLSFEWKIEGFNSIGGDTRLLSPTFGLPAAPWRLLAFPAGNYLAGSPSQSTRPSLSLYLDAPKSHTAPPDRPTQSATFDLIVRHPTNPSLTLRKECSHRFSRNACDWGYAQMVDLGTLRDQGFIEDPQGAAVVTLAVEGTCVIPHAEFCSLDTLVELPPNTGGAMLGHLYGSGLFCDVKLRVVPPSPGRPTQPGTTLLSRQGCAPDSRAAPSTSHGAVSSAGEASGMADCLVVEASPQPPSNPCLTSCEQTAAPAETFQCHRLVLAAASPPLRAMLGGGAGAEMREAGQAEVVLHDTEPEVAKSWVQWMYGVQGIQVPVSQLVPLWSLGHQWDMQALCDSCISAITSLLDRHPELSLDLYGITRRTAPDTSPLCTAVCQALERHLALIASFSDFKSLPWHRIFHVLRCAWDRYCDAGPLQAVWQVPHDMLMVLDAVTEWLKHHHSWPPSSPPGSQKEDESMHLSGSSTSLAKGRERVPAHTHSCSIHTAARLAYVADLLDLTQLNTRYARNIQTHPLVSFTTELISKEAAQQDKAPGTSVAGGCLPCVACTSAGISERPHPGSMNGTCLEGVGARGQVVYQSLCKQLQPWVRQVPAPDNPEPATPSGNDAAPDEQHGRLATGTEAREAAGGASSPNQDPGGMTQHASERSPVIHSQGAVDMGIGSDEQPREFATTGAQVLGPPRPAIQPENLPTSNGVDKAPEGSKCQQQNQDSPLQQLATEAVQQAAPQLAQRLCYSVVSTNNLRRNQYLPSCVTGVIVTRRLAAQHAGSGAASGATAAHQVARQVAAHPGEQESAAARQPPVAATRHQHSSDDAEAPTQHTTITPGRSTTQAENSQGAQQVQGRETLPQGVSLTRPAGRSVAQVPPLMSTTCSVRPPAVPELEPLARLSRQSTAVAMSCRAYHPLEQGVQH